MDAQRIEPGPGQGTVRDCSRPPRLGDTDQRTKVIFGGVTLACARRAKRTLETSRPPVCYIPAEGIRMEHLALAEGPSFREWKGVACYYDIETDEQRGSRAAWFYPNPVPAYAGIKDYVAFYPSLMDACWANGEKVRVQEGDFYGGWITPDIVGPFKGAVGTWGW